MNGASAPCAEAYDADLELAARYAPIILFDEAEPFLPLAVGVTVFPGRRRLRLLPSPHPA